MMLVHYVIVINILPVYLDSPSLDYIPAQWHLIPSNGFSMMYEFHRRTDKKRKTSRQKHRQTDRERHTQTKTDRQTDTDTNINKQSNRQTDGVLPGVFQ